MPHISRWEIHWDHRRRDYIGVSSVTGGFNKSHICGFFFFTTNCRDCPVVCPRTEYPA